jgi:hypothetical protein
LSNSIHVLATVYNEAEFLSYSLRSYLPHVNSVTLVEGAYRETIAIGASARSTDGTISIAQKYVSENVQLIEANEESDAHQRNIGLGAIRKQYGTDGWLLIVDGDEVYEPITLKMINALTHKMEQSNAKAAYFKSLTFVNDFQHYTEQEFPRLFKLTEDCSFINDNYMRWGTDTAFAAPTVIKTPNIKFFHYSFCKGNERFALKKKWWETRFKQPFHYSWSLDSGGQITDRNHVIRAFTGKHPEIMKNHPLLAIPGDFHD